MLRDEYVISSKDCKSRNILDPCFIGNKAVGLLNLPEVWVPPFIVLTNFFYLKWKELGRASKVWDEIPVSQQKIIFDYINNSKYQSLLIRSNSPGEGINERGKYNSYSVKKNVTEMLPIIDAIFQESLPNMMNIIIQEAISPSMLGHFSNERRFAQTQTKWYVEWNNGTSSRFINAANTEEVDPLFVKKQKNLTTVLKKVAGHLSKSNNKRYHCEWLWNGERLWIVQADSIITKIEQSEIYDKFVITEKKSNNNIGELQIIKHFHDIEVERWKKLQAPSQFNKLGFPCADIYVLPGDIWAKTQLRERIYNDLRTLFKFEPIVIRCDISKEINKSDLLLPTSNPIDKISDAIEFLNNTTKIFESQNIEASHWAFLIANLFEVTASALVHSLPNTQRIRVDALWGYPDGLLYYPHDTYFYYPSTKKITTQNKWKNYYLTKTNNTWVNDKICEPFDWKQVLNRSAISTIANWAKQLSDSTNEEIQLMVFYISKPSMSTNNCLPWHYTNLPIKHYTEHVGLLPLADQIITIESWANLDEFTDNKSKNKYKGILILPTALCLRDDTFILKCSKIAKEMGIPIYYQGSLMSHAYYLMVGSGARVIPVLKEEPKEKPIIYNKLVRDKIPLIIKQAGGIARVKTLSKESAISLLSQKIIEEAYELWNSQDENEIIYELVDLYEIIMAIQKYLGFSSEQFQTILTKKNEKRGGFENLIYLEETQIGSFGLVDVNEGTLPLFKEEDVRFSSKKENRESSIKFLKTEADLLKFQIPLIPPIKKNGDYPIIEERNEKYFLRIKYINNTAVISVSESFPKQENTTRLKEVQLKLF